MHPPPTAAPHSPFVFFVPFAFFVVCLPLTRRCRELELPGYVLKPTEAGCPHPSPHHEPDVAGFHP
ncbi:MAG: hypothetical protein HC911_17090 [Chloroflexaceae bacterium]|nr:hypothetical protein [Chloroflexaceae bacterium]